MFWRLAKRGARGKSKSKKKRKQRLVLSSNYHCHVLGRPGAPAARLPSGGGGRSAGPGR